MSVPKLSLILMVLLIFASQFFVSATLAEVTEEEAASALSSAEGSVFSAYQSVLKAEEAGANVSSLLFQLNRAGELLTQAKMSYRIGDFDNAINFANSSRNIGEEVQDAAFRLKDSALSEVVQRMLFTMVASVVGVALIALGSLCVWHILKRRHGSSGSLKAN